MIETHSLATSAGGVLGIILLLTLWHISTNAAAAERVKWAARGRWFVVPGVIAGTLLTQATPSVQTFAIGFVAGFLVAGWVVAVLRKATDPTRQR